MKKFIMVIMMVALMVPGIAFADEAYSNQTQNQTQNQYGYTDSNASQSQATVFGVDSLIKDSFNAGPSKRGFAIPNEVHFPGMPSYFGKAIPSFQFQSVKTMLMYKSVFSISELKQMARGKGSSTKIIPTIVNDSYIPTKKEETQFIEDMGITKDDTNIDDYKYIVIYLTKPKVDVDLIGYITAASKSKNGVSVKTVAQAALAAYKMGADIIHISAEGAERKLTTNGWGIGFNQTHSTINGGGENTGNVSSGGTGYSTGSSGYRDLPWIQVFCLHSQNK